MISRRHILSRIGLGSLAALIASVAQRARAQDAHEGHAMPAMPAPAPAEATPAGSARQAASSPAAGYTPVRTLNGWTLPYTMKDGVKEFHLVAEEVQHEFAPGSVAKCWGYNGSTPGPTIEAVEGDRVRIFVTNRLKEHTTIHWHGLYLPSGMDGVGGLNQPHIQPGETFVYEFTLRQHGTHMYHPHADEMVQLAVGMMGMFIIHPKSWRTAPDRPRLLLPAAQLGAAPGHLPPRPVDHDGVRSLDLQLEGVSRDRAAGGAHGRARAHPRRQPVDARAPDPPARRAVPRHRRRRRAAGRRIAGAPR